MTGGFTFDGTDIADLGLEYAPELNNTYIYKPASYKTHEQVFDGHHGGYYYGSTVQPKDFTLRCIYEGHKITDGFMTNLFHVFRRDKVGKLVFQKRPWCWYVATVMNVNIDQLLNFENGVVTITLRAHYPFARSDYSVIPENSEYETDMLKNSGMMPYGWQDTVSFASDQNTITSDKTLLVYNPGTERAKVAVRIAGDVGTGVSLANVQTEQSMRFVAISRTTCPGSFYVQCDGLNGQTTLTNGRTSSPGFLYHDYGFIELEPGFPAYRNIPVEVYDNRTVTSEGLFTEDMLGRYIYFANGTHAKIQRIDNDSNLQVDQTVGSAESGAAQILLMNEIQVSASPSGGAFNIHKLDFIYHPTFL